jgi:predicted MarR family transcription regulator
MYDWINADSQNKRNSIPDQYALYVEERLLPEARNRTIPMAILIDKAHLRDHRLAKKSHMSSAYGIQVNTFKPWQVRDIFHNGHRIHRSRFSMRSRENV